LIKFAAEKLNCAYFQKHSNLLYLYRIYHVGEKKIEIKPYKKSLEVFLKKLVNRKNTVHLAHHGPVQPSPKRVTVRAGRSPDHQAATWAWAGKAVPRLGQKRPARPRNDRDRPIAIDGRALIPADQNPERALLPETLAQSLFAPLSLSFFLLATATEAMAPPRASSPASALACT
jgi:hypothetical protein